MTQKDRLKGKRHNFLVLASYHVLLRTGWIFKTESIIMPAILDAIGGGGWLRGCLPMLNRIGQSVPPILVSDRIRRISHKKWVLSCCVAFMGFSFLALAATWFLLDGERPAWLVYLFLTVYGVFWLCVGVHNLSVSLLYGKLIAVKSRGRLMLVATTLGAFSAIVCVWFLMRKWLSTGTDGFLWLFLFTGCAFVLASVLALFLKEDADSSPGKSKSIPETLQLTFEILRRDSNFRCLALISACYGMSITLFPHYQAYVRHELNVGLEAFVPWVIAQNLGAAVFSIPLGRMADRFGNRLAIRFSTLLLCVAPLLTIFWINYPTGNPEVGFYVVFFLLGLTPVTMRTFSNYTLEIAKPDQQPIYLSTLGVCMALPVILMSTTVGALVDVIGFESMFIFVVTILFVGWVLTFRLEEPRMKDQEKQSSGPQTTGLM